MSNRGSLTAMVPDQWLWSTTQSREPIKPAGHCCSPRVSSFAAITHTRSQYHHCTLPMAPTTCSCKHDGDDHAFIRCGCQNDYPDGHAMHLNDDAFHHVWCLKCLKFCYKNPVCPVELPRTQIARLNKEFVQADAYVHFFTT
ncbi:hypothetical protein GALMADRAFT_245556 [Galerina marginata CBS 339.88]|uniref:Uncharacterized protein n=1 Tax=Galerina marginata (strain CBS 339.88) TaxID=685588 RepID=A0A067THE8_GALM3|nr:hypothetical protein GALMADRAFT_245556 [Galerina marginata CBS 339.88]